MVPDGMIGNTKMVKFNETDAGLAFVASGDSRETSTRIMEAIAFFARNEAEAVAVWEGDFGNVCTLADIWENATSNGRIDATDLCWGAAGIAWFAESVA